MGTFSYSEFEDVVMEFSKEVPELLKKHPLTSGIALEIHSLNLNESLEQRFTAAIIGQMRVGKSMLLNSLIGKNLAPTGVKETTATINWFRHGEGEICNKFRVHWSDGSEEDFDLNRIDEWIGTEKNIESTKSIDFFADADFLKTANIVDTPGTRSVIDTHERTTEGFLSEKLESATLKFGGKADAVIYVINPVGREADSDILKLFGEKTRLPGASAFNSIAVIQKWEHLQPDPLVQVQQKCERLKNQLSGKVADVIPTSGLIANHVLFTSDLILEKIARLSMNSSSDALEMLLLSEDDFQDPCEGASLDIEERKTILKEFSWKILPLCINETRKRQLDSADELRDMLNELSGIPRLKKVLEANFFSKSRLIKTSSLFKKAWEPSQVALHTLRNEIEKKKNTLEKGKIALKSIESNRYAALTEAKAYFEETINFLIDEISTLQEIQERLDHLKYKIERFFEVFDHDMQCLSYLEKNTDSFTENFQDLLILFGSRGPGIKDRMPELKDKNYDIHALEKKYANYYKEAGRKTGDMKKVYMHAYYITDKIIEHLEAKHE